MTQKRPPGEGDQPHPSPEHAREILPVPETPAEALPVAEQRDLAKEMLEAGEMNAGVQKRVELLLGLSINEALAKLSDKPEVLEAYHAAFSGAEDERERLFIEFKKLKQHPDSYLKMYVALGILEVLRDTDCAEILARGLAPDDSLATYENARIGSLKKGSAETRDGNHASININQNNTKDWLIISKLLDGAGMRAILAMQGAKENTHIPKILLRNDFWTMMSHISSPNYLPEAMTNLISPNSQTQGWTPAKLAIEAQHFAKWFALEPRIDDGKFYSGKIDKRQRAVRKQDVEAAWGIAKIARTKIIEPIQKRELAKRTSLLHDFHDANDRYQEAKTAADAESKPLARLWSMVNSPANKIREIHLAAAVSAGAERDQALNKLLVQQQNLAGNYRSYNLAMVEDNRHKDGAPTSYNPNSTYQHVQLASEYTLRYWSELAAEEFAEIATKDLARPQLAALKKRT